MQQEPVREALTTEYVQTLLKIKAHQLARRPAFRRTEPDDIKHDLISHVLKQADNFDPSRSCAKTFITRVVETAAAMLVRNRGRLKRAAGFRAISLEGTVLRGDGRERSLSELIDETDLRRRYGGDARCPHDQADLAADLTELLAVMPLELRRIAGRLMDGREASVARDLGTSRRQIRNAVAAIRKRFEEAGFREI